MRQIKLTGEKNNAVKDLIYSLLNVLVQIGMPIDGKSDRRLERMAEACLAVGCIKSSLSEARSSSDGIFLKTRDIISFVNEHYGENISPGSYDDIRRKDLIDLVEMGIVVNSSLMGKQATNNPTRGYALSPHFSKLLKSHGSDTWQENLKNFQIENTELINSLYDKRKKERVPVTLPTGETLTLSAGEHNRLQKLVIEQFLPIFGMGAQILYVGDTTDKFLYRADEQLSELGFFDLQHDELPDIVAYSKNKELLFLIEAVHSAGPMSEIRVKKLKRQLKNCLASVVYITAFLNRKDFRKWVTDIAWETEVWIAAEPEHLVHFNGYKFLELHR